MAIMPGTISGERIDYGHHERNPRLTSERLPKPEDLLGQSDLLQQLSKALIKRVLDGEMTHHLGYEKRSPFSGVELARLGRASFVCYIKRLHCRWSKRWRSPLRRVPFCAYCIREIARQEFRWDSYSP